MSLPAIAGAPISSIGPMVLGPLDAAILSLNSNPYFIGPMMLFLNLGGRFVACSFLQFSLSVHAM